MSKIVCDICGTSYQDTAECCPICGCARGAAADLLEDELTVEESAELGAEAAASKKKQIFDYDEVNTLMEQEDVEIEEEETDFDEEEDEEEKPRHNTFVVILLTILIAALLVAAGFIFVRYFLPNMGGEEDAVPATTVAVQEEAAPVETEQRIACETLILNSTAKAELTEVGFSHLINVMPSPKDTTDKLIFVSADQSVATVSEDGKITAVGEGETIVTITCGDVQMFVNVSCNFTPATEPATEETAAAEETVSAEENSTEAVEETVAETEAKKDVDSSITLKLKKTDISLGVYYQFQLELDCDLDPKDVEWSVEHSYVASVTEEGVVTALKKGATTDIIVKYGDQEVRCKVRVV